MNSPVGSSLDDPGLDAVLEDIPVVPLQPQTDPVGEGRRRSAAGSAALMRPPQVMAFSEMSNALAIRSLPPDMNSTT